MNRILLLLDHKANNRLLAETLQPYYEVLQPDGAAIPDVPFDLAIVDDRAMGRLRMAIIARRAAEKPLLLPFIYVTNRQDVRLITPEVWESVDDLLVAPTGKRELLARIKIHMRARSYALELKQRNDELIKLDTMKDQFLSIISHELRTPLNAIMGFGSVLDDEIMGLLNAEQHHYLEKIMVGSEHMLKLVEELLVMSRIQAGQFTLDLETVDVAAVAALSLEGLRKLAETKSIALTGQFPADLSPMIADSRRINQVLINLINNAIKFTPADGTIHVMVHQDGSQLIFEVADTGMGIHDDDLPDLFLRFTQVDSTFTRAHGGTGLGLAIAKGIVSAHGGHIGVRTVLGEGSTFWFSLPLLTETSSVRLVRDLPAHSLKVGALGTIVAIRTQPQLTYEVAFTAATLGLKADATLAVSAGWIEPVDVQLPREGASV